MSRFEIIRPGCLFSYSFTEEKKKKKKVAADATGWSVECKIHAINRPDLARDRARRRACNREALSYFSKKEVGVGLQCVGAAD